MIALSSLKDKKRLIKPKMHRNWFPIFIKFGLTGLSGLFVDFSITWVFKEWLLVNKFLANALGFSVAVLSNYFINRKWTFKSERKLGRQLLAFIVVSVLGLLLNSFVVYLFNHIFLFNFYLSKLIAIGLVFFWNFTVNYFFVFNSPKTPSAS
jgi:putative flippase GtrA